MEKKKVLVNSKFWPENMGPFAEGVEQALASLGEVADVEVFTPASEDEIVERIRDVDAAIPQMRTKWRELLEAANRLKMVQVPAQGLVLLDVAACTKKGIICCNVQNAGAESVAQHALALMLAVSKHIVQEDHAMRSSVLRSSLGMELDGKTLGVVGLGSVGGRVALKCRLAFNMRVLAYDPYIPLGDEQVYGAKFVDLETLLKESDVVVVCALLTPETRHMLGAEQLGLMKKNAILVNMVGAVVDEKALIEALQKRKIWGVGIDVLEEEPLTVASLAEPNVKALHAIDDLDVVITPHSSRLTTEAIISARVAAIHNVTRFVRGEKPYWIVNPAVLPLKR